MFGGMRLKIKAVCGVEIFETGCRGKLQWWASNKTATCRTSNESESLKIHKGTTLV